MIKTSIIIPCFNQGEYLKEALVSIENAKVNDIEIIIVNDGSTEDKTIEILKELELEGFTIFHKENGGLSSARNAGIAIAKGDYILPLDSDNKVLSSYLRESVKIMDENPDISVLYGNPIFFGDRIGLQSIGQFNLQRLMLFNYIDACALIRKSVFEIVGDYDTNLKYGFEDWEMWLRIAFKGLKFYYLDVDCFYYRVRENSMSRSIVQDYSKINFTENYINSKHERYMGHSWIVGNFIERFKKSPIKLLFKITLRAYFPKYYSQLLLKNKIRNGI